MHRSNLLFAIGATLLAAVFGCSETKGKADNTIGPAPVAEDTITELPSPVCDEPDLWPLPSATHWVGDGSAASCTEDALRQATANGGHIRFDCGAENTTIILEQEIFLNRETVIDGENKITLDGAEKTRIFRAATKLSLRNLRFNNGAALEEGDNGGAVSGEWRSQVEVVGCVFENNIAQGSGGAISVWTGSTLSVLQSRFLRNRSGYGGAIYSLWSPLHIVNSEFTSNSTLRTGGGGAIGTDGAFDPAYREEETVGGTIEICGSLFRDNRAFGAGGSAFIWAYPPDTIIIDRSTIQDNILEKDGGLAMGGGMRVSNGLITIKASSFLSNSAGTHGGGLSLDCEPTCTITNSTFYANRVEDGYGGALFGNKLRINNVTFAHNFASGHGGALFGGDDWVLNNSVFVDNKAGNPWQQANSCAATGTGAHILQWVSELNGTGSDPCIPDVLAADPLLTEPADNEGPTFTMMPSDSSPALQAGAHCEPVDQRGMPRDTNACDLGAVER